MLYPQGQDHRITVGGEKKPPDNAELRDETIV
jgi:hypothetical protein